LKLCDVPEPIRKMLLLSHLHKLFDSHESEDTALLEKIASHLQPAC